MQLFRLWADQLEVGRPLPWNVYSEQGQLLLTRGYQLVDQAQLDTLAQRGMFVAQGDFDAQRRTTTPAPQHEDPVSLWSTITEQLSALQSLQADDAQLLPSLNQTAEGVQQAVSQHRESTLFEALREDDPRGYAVSHAMQTAFLASLVAQRLGWSSGDRQLMSQAALSMNLGMTPLQSQLSTQTTPLSAEQRHAVHHHGRAGRAALEQAGVTDRQWLHAVEYHHVTPDGGPLPADHARFGELACMLHYADVYLAKISARATRPALPSHVAARQLFLQADGQRNPYVASIIKELGVYPPGSCVRLANGEMAVVARRGEQAHQPKVCSLVAANGRPLPYPVRRPTEQPVYKITEALPRGSLRHCMPDSRKLAQALAD